MVGIAIRLLQVVASQRQLLIKKTFIHIRDEGLPSTRLCRQARSPRYHPDYVRRLENTNQPTSLGSR